MSLNDWFQAKSLLALEGEGVRLRPYRTRDYAQWAAVRFASREFLQPWEPTWPADDLTRAGFRRRMGIYQREMDLGIAFTFLTFNLEGELVGGVSLSNVRRGVALMASLGYWCAKGHARKGRTLAGAKAVCAFAFERLGLHRIEAACVPENAASRALLLKAGFKEEGKAQAYLKINGVWRDHLTFGLLNGGASG